LFLGFNRDKFICFLKAPKTFWLLCVAEAGVHAVLAEMKADYQFVTHGNPYIPQKGWTNPAKHKHWLLGDVEGLKLDHSEKGVYTGRLTMSKTRITGYSKYELSWLGLKTVSKQRPSMKPIGILYWKL